MRRIAMTMPHDPATAPSPPTAPDLADPRWLPLTYDAGHDAFRFATIDLEMLGHAPFLDQRLGPVWQQALAVSAIDVDHAAGAPAFARPAPAWLFHTAFCCSTLLARALHAPPAAVALKEPHALMAMAQLSLHESRLPPGLLDARLRTTVALLGRPWTADGRILVKPTNAVNRLLPRLLALAPARAILLHGGLEDFLVSCCKKLPGAQAPMRWMAQYLLPGTRLEPALAIPSDHELNFVEACVLTWYAQMELYADALAADGSDRLRSLDMAALLAQPEGTVRACARHLALEVGDDASARVAQVFARDSKRTDASHGRERRDAERAAVLERHGELVRAGLAWAERVVAPWATLPDWKQLEIE
jgi:hypothetical protein